MKLNAIVLYSVVQHFVCWYAFILVDDTEEQERKLSRDLSDA